jgi:hypothetical protein
MHPSDCVFIYVISHRLTQAKNIMVSANTRKGCYMSILNIIQGAVDPTQVRHYAMLYYLSTSSYRKDLLTLMLYHAYMPAFIPYYISLPRPGSQGPPAHPGAQAGGLHPLGPGQHTGGAVKEEPVRRHAEQGEIK